MLLCKMRNSECLHEAKIGLRLMNSDSEHQGGKITKGVESDRRLGTTAQRVFCSFTFRRATETKSWDGKSKCGIIVPFIFLSPPYTLNAGSYSWQINKLCSLWEKAWTGLHVVRGGRPRNNKHRCMLVRVRNMGSAPSCWSPGIQKRMWNAERQVLDLVFINTRFHCVAVKLEIAVNSEEGTASELWMACSQNPGWLFSHVGLTPVAMIYMLCQRFLMGL